MLISEVTDPETVATVAELAREIWTEHYVPIIGPEQVEYMLRTIQSERAISDQIAKRGYSYFLIAQGGAPVGYIGVQDDGDVLFLSKVYVRSSARGNGLGKRAVDFVRAHALANGHRLVRLTVNINNDVAIGAYERLGFSRTGTKVADIGGGFVMDDYVYEIGV